LELGYLKTWLVWRGDEGLDENKGRAAGYAAQPFFVCLAGQQRLVDWPE